MKLSNLSAVPTLPAYPDTGWRTIYKFEDYEVSTRGHVRARFTHVAKPVMTVRNGYIRAKLMGPCGRWHWRPVHVLVLEAFVSYRPTPRHHGAHGPDRDKANNTLENLRWATPEENERDKRAHGTQSRGGARTPLHANTVRTIKKLVAKGLSYTAIGKRLGLHRTTVQRTWCSKRRAA